LPTFNEKDNIVPLIEELRSRFRAAGHRYEILVIDDQSPDGTGSAVAAAFADDPGVRVTVRRKNPGLAYSIREGIERSTGAIVLVMDSDFNHKPADAVLLFQVAQYVDSSSARASSSAAACRACCATISAISTTSFCAPPSARGWTIT
jgi:dolichol-phosphate mannosyltransferase